MNEITKELGRYIVEQRTIKGLSAYKLAKLLEIDRGNLSRIENGKAPIPRAETLQKISRVLEINVIELYKIAGYLTENELNDYYKNKENA